MKSVLEIIRSKAAAYSIAGLMALPMLAQVPAQLRSAAGYPTGNFIGPTAPAGGLVEGQHFWGCDGLQSFIRYTPADPTNPDPVNTGILIPTITGVNQISLIMSRCAQAAFDGNKTAFMADPENRKGSGGIAVLGGVKRVVFDLTTDTLTPDQTGIATTAGLDGDNPTAVAVGPDGNVYVGFLKNGNIKRILNPYVGTTQTVQAVGGTPSGRPMRAMAFVGTDLYLASSDSLSVIRNAVSPACQGGCNAQVIQDGFTGNGHVGLTTDGINRIYMAVNNQVWRYTISSGASSMVSAGGVDPTGLNLPFAFQGGRTNLLQLDRLGNLWIGDDTSDGALNFHGRVFFISAASLASLP